MQTCGKFGGNRPGLLAVKSGAGWRGKHALFRSKPQSCVRSHFSMPWHPFSHCRVHVLCNNPASMDRCCFSSSIPVQILSFLYLFCMDLPLQQSCPPCPLPAQLTHGHLELAISNHCSSPMNSRSSISLTSALSPVLASPQSLESSMPPVSSAH